MDLNKLFVTQHSLRNLEQLPAMIEFARENKLFDVENLGAFAIIHGLRPAPLIEIAQFEDGSYYLHNGHHRAVACYLGRESQRIMPTEFFIRQWKYSDYTDIVLPHWVTPFDPRTETRNADLKEWKDAVRINSELFAGLTEPFGKEYIIDMILRNKFLYSQPRKMYTVGDLAYEIRKAIR